MYSKCACVQMAVELCLAARGALAATGVPPEAVDVEMRIAGQLASLECTGFGARRGCTSPSYFPTAQSRLWGLTRSEPKHQLWMIANVAFRWGG